MRQLRTVCMVFLLGAAGPVRLASADIKVIANFGVGAVSTTSAEIKAVFLVRQTYLSDGSRVQPVVLKGTAGEVFARSYLGKSVNGLETYYRGLVFAGTGVIPKMLDSDDEVIAYVSRTKGAIAYISGAGATTGRVRVLVVK